MLGHELLLFKTMKALRAPAVADHRSDQGRRRRTVAEAHNTCIDTKVGCAFGSVARCNLLPPGGTPWVPYRVGVLVG